MQANIDNEQLTISLLFSTNSLRTHLQKSVESPQKSISYSFLPENQNSNLHYAAWRKWRLWRNGGEVCHFRHSATCWIYISRVLLRLLLFRRDTKLLPKQLRTYNKGIPKRYNILISPTLVCTCMKIG